jgi:hypothetical protein
MLEPIEKSANTSPKKRTNGKMWQLEIFLNTCFLLTKSLNSSKEKKRKSWSGDGDDKTP